MGKYDNWAKRKSCHSSIPRRAGRPGLVAKQVMVHPSDGKPYTTTIYVSAGGGDKEAEAGAAKVSGAGAGMPPGMMKLAPGSAQADKAAWEHVSKLSEKMQLTPGEHHLLADAHDRKAKEAWGGRDDASAKHHEALAAAHRHAFDQKRTTGKLATPTFPLNRNVGLESAKQVEHGDD